MARFVGHESCPACGSRDNLGRYDDGSAFCFGCKYTERAKHAPPRTLKETNDERTTPQLPDDTGNYFAPVAVEWLASYHCTVEQAIRAGVRWSESRQQLIFTLEDGCWQARNFNEFQASKRKYFTTGDVNSTIKVYSAGEKTSPSTQRLAIVEDCLSAIRISEVTDAMPVLGSHLSSARLTRVARFYEEMVIWLDHDKLKEARDIAMRAKMLGRSTRVIYTDDDPKCFTTDKLKEILNVQ